jgi:hypothetical protein
MVVGGGNDLHKSYVATKGEWRCIVWYLRIKEFNPIDGKQRLLIVGWINHTLFVVDS